MQEEVKSIVENSSATLRLIFSTIPEEREMLIAMLGELSFHAFEEPENGLVAYIEEEHFSKDKTEALINSSIFYNTKLTSSERILWENWNQVWESEYEPVLIPPFCAVIASFHETPQGFEHIVKIQPQMSFGTGHHETTRLMIELMAELSFTDTKVLDMGCGTGILGILARKLGASEVTGIDIEEHAILNCYENVALNQLTGFTWICGTANAIPDLQVNYILANINRNILLQDVLVYKSSLIVGGKILLSGFFDFDVSLIKDCYTKSGFSLLNEKSENNWSALVFELL